ncbi:MAG: hypothetical protein EOO46_20190 [Flavobacterium sp.]|nr:MAG: hypothetical protein EOO46_20190 [Flavobacterium sp.]
MRYLYLCFIVFALYSCKSEHERTVHTKKGEIIRYGNQGIDNREAAALFNKGLQSVEERDFYSAEEYFQKADSIEKDNSAILNALALTCEKFDNDEEAERIYTRIFSKDSSTIATYANYGRFLLYREQPKEANKLLLKGYKYTIESNKYPEPALIMNLAISYSELKDCKSAIKYAREAQEYAQNKDLKSRIAVIIQHIREKCQ